MLEKYSLLRQDFLNIAEPFIDSNVLDQLKRNYAHEIDSKRKLSQIKDLKTFIRLLEKRNIVSYSNIEPLWYISKTYIHKPDLDNKLQDYENWLKNLTMPLLSLYDIYQKDETSEFTSLESACSSHHNLSQSSIRGSSTILSSNIPQTLHCNQKTIRQNVHDLKIDKLQNEVIVKIQDRMGRYWRDIARHLGIRECDIDAIQNKYPYDSRDQSREMLLIYTKQSDMEQWAINLIRALEKARRRDLKEIVEELTLKIEKMYS
ncbi:fas-associated death domain protein isoform X2 [Solenopsis invicta]|nr:fas-associated death domain protein isoform X2 [Solenopsis invicta]XP_025993580.1 fas-associated death domain protein isoform X2 [Solenopsis invicta]